MRLFLFLTTLVGVGHAGVQDVPPVPVDETGHCSAGFAKGEDCRCYKPVAEMNEVIYHWQLGMIQYNAVTKDLKTQYFRGQKFVLFPYSFILDGNI